MNGGVRPTEGGEPRPVYVNVLDCFEVRSDGQSVALGRCAQRLVAFLALNDQRPLPRAYVAGTLWMESSDARSMANLRATLWRLSQCSCRLVDAQAGLLRLAPTTVVDLNELLHLSRRLLEPTDDCVGLLGWSSVAVLTAELLPDWPDDDWVILEREHLRQVRLHALEALADRLIRLNRHGQAVEAALVAVRTEPLQESANALLIRAHLLGGNRAQAIRQYERCAELLRVELGVGPSPQLTTLIRQLACDASSPALAPT